MADYRELIRILQHQEKGRPVFFQPYLSRGLWERLVWRSGETPWKDAFAAAKVYIDGSVIAGFDAVCLSFSPDSPFRASQKLLEQVEKVLPPGMKVVDLGGAGSPSDCIEPKTIHDLESYYRQVLASQAVCAVMVGDFSQHRQNSGLTIEKAQEFRQICRKAICEETHRRGNMPSMPPIFPFRGGWKLPWRMGLTVFGATRRLPLSWRNGGSITAKSPCWVAYPRIFWHKTNQWPSILPVKN